MKKRTPPRVRTGPGQLLQLRIALEEIKPPIWRRIVVPSDATLYALHEIIQTVMGWGNGHLHQFSSGSGEYTVPDEDTERGVKDERRYTVARLIQDGPPWVYEYDFGDGWRHRIEFEKALKADDPEPKCLDGARACPPEDVGGPFGYEEFLLAIKDPKHERHEELLEWIGGEFEPEAFSADEVNDELAEVWKNGLPAFDDEG